MEFTAVCQFSRLFSGLSLNSLRIQVKLGCSAEERMNPQYVRFDIRVRFPSRPEGCLSDRLVDTVCYAELSEIVRKVSTAKEYDLIEKLGWDTFSSIKEILPKSVQLWLRTTKEKPPVPELVGGAAFSLGDWEEF